MSERAVRKNESKPLAYSVPWRLIAGLWRNLAEETPASVDDFSAAVVSRMTVPPLILGTENLPKSARFVLAANHYQRKGLWILHAAAALTQAVRQHYGPGDPPIRWVVTANWPPIRVGPFCFRSPGDILLPRMARLWSCYAVSFAGTNPTYTARALRQILRQTPSSNRPLGLFPEGAAGTAGKLTHALPGVERLLVHLARAGVPVMPVGISEAGRLVLQFGDLIRPEEILAADDAGALTMKRIAQSVLSKREHFAHP